MRTSYNPYLLLLAIILPAIWLFGCRNQTANDKSLWSIQQDSARASHGSQWDASLVKAPYNTLGPDAIKALENTIHFQNIRQAMDSLARCRRQSEIHKLAVSIYTNSSTLSKKLPPELQSKQILARIQVLTTTSGIINNNAPGTPPYNHYKKPAGKLLKSIEALVSAYNNLIRQLNEQTLKIPENIAKELLRS